MIGYIEALAILIIGVFIASAAQILLKKSADKKHATQLKEYLNPLVATGYAMLLVSSFLAILAMRVLDLRLIPMIESLGYIFVLGLSSIFLKEHITKTKIIGMTIIILGIIIFNLSEIIEVLT
ncbi:multidrug ABC transporter [archaeon]|nr:multidrug ABC transporter [archaeon]